MLAPSLPGLVGGLHEGDIGIVTSESAQPLELHSEVIEPSGLVSIHLILVAVAGNDLSVDPNPAYDRPTMADIYPALTCASHTNTPPREHNQTVSLLRFIPHFLVLTVHASAYARKVILGEQSNTVLMLTSCFESGCRAESYLLIAAMAAPALARLDSDDRRVGSSPVIIAIFASGTYASGVVAVANVDFARCEIPPCRVRLKVKMVTFVTRGAVLLLVVVFVKLDSVCLWGSVRTLRLDEPADVTIEHVSSVAFNAYGVIVSSTLVSFGRFSVLAGARIWCAWLLRDWFGETGGRR